ncbi:MAG: aromatic ring-hydroxylating dioxygenase subunit alpha, partial [Pseudomonadales bacterium]
MTLPYANLVSDDGSYINRKVFADPELYQLEKQHIFGRNWIYMGHESQLVKPGDFITSFIGETPV